MQIFVQIICCFGLLKAIHGFVPTNSNFALVKRSLYQSQNPQANLLQDFVELFTSSKKGKTEPTSVITEPVVKSGVTLLEGNSWACELAGIKIFVDPVFDTLDFGIPFLYKADRKSMSNEDLEKDLVESANVMLISQGLADHCCPKTQSRLSKVLKDSVQIIAPPSAAPVLKSLYPEGRVKYVSPGETVEIQVEDKTLKVTVTSGALVGPPWQANENGYILQCADSPSLYYEPHCMFEESELGQLQADYIITPVVGQILPVYGPLVDGMEKALKLADVLNAKGIIPLMNGELDAEGALDDIISPKGSISDFEALLVESKSSVSLLSSPPGKEILI